MVSVVSLALTPDPNTKPKDQQSNGGPFVVGRIVSRDSFAVRPSPLALVHSFALGYISDLSMRTVLCTPHLYGCSELANESAPFGFRLVATGIAVRSARLSGSTPRTGQMYDQPGEIPPAHAGGFRMGGM